ncbi:MAG TPA: ABC transporter permease subunit [Polyangiales bacterium]
MNWRSFRALLRLELSDALRAKWVALTFALYAGLGAAFVWLGLRESSVLGFTGLSRALLNLTSALIVVCPLLVLIGTHGALVRARSSGFCELMLTQPVPRWVWFSAVLAARVLVLAGPFLLLACCAGVASFSLGGEAGVWMMALKSLGVCVALIVGFVGIGLSISAATNTTERAMVWALVAFVVTSALHDVLLISVLLRTSLPPQLVFALASLNPSEAARVGILASADPELSVLGPVGFWLANALGPSLALGAAMAWPALLGVLTAGFALWRIQRADLVT